MTEEQLKAVRDHYADRLENAKREWFASLGRGEFDRAKRITPSIAKYAGELYLAEFLLNPR